MRAHRRAGLGPDDRRSGLVEPDLDDKPVLHLKAQGARADMDPLANPGSGPSALHAKFEVRYQTPKTGGK